jgi:hypothetical protein
MQSAQAIPVDSISNATLGRYLKKYRSEWATEILSLVSSEPKPVEDDLSMILGFYDLFVKASNGPQNRTEAVYQKRVFVGAILHLYSPNIFNDRSRYSITKGLIKELSAVLSFKKSYVSEYLVPEAVMGYKTYDEFKADVNTTLQKLNSHGR